MSMWECAFVVHVVQPPHKAAHAGTMLLLATILLCREQGMRVADLDLWKNRPPSSNKDPLSTAFGLSWLMKSQQSWAG